MNQETQGYSLTKKTEGQKSRDTVPLIQNIPLFGENKLPIPIFLEFLIIVCYFRIFHTCRLPVQNMGTIFFYM
jgi:hypothetical protein